jgi:hypothetical protein
LGLKAAVGLGYGRASIWKTAMFLELLLDLPKYFDNQCVTHELMLFDKTKRKSWHKRVLILVT